MTLRELANRAVDLSAELAEIGVAALRDCGMDPAIFTVLDVPESHPSWNRIQEIQRERAENARLRGVGHGHSIHDFRKDS